MTTLATVRDRAPTGLTPGCLAKRLVELQEWLYRRFPAYAADSGLDAARQAGLRYIERAEKGEVRHLENEEAYLRFVAIRAARRCQQRELPCVSIQFVVVVSVSHDACEEKIAAIVRSALDALPQRQREAVLLRVVDECSLRDIARRMKITRQSVKRYLDSALAYLRDSLANHAKK
jgi:RNA polymerase sigma factor (sigma-70 family)